jgi:hypothetical protein
MGLEALDLPWEVGQSLSAREPAGGPQLSCDGWTVEEVEALTRWSHGGRDGWVVGVRQGPDPGQRVVRMVAVGVKPNHGVFVGQTVALMEGGNRGVTFLECTWAGRKVDLRYSSGHLVMWITREGELISVLARGMRDGISRHVLRSRNLVVV